MDFFDSSFAGTVFVSLGSDLGASVFGMEKAVDQDVEEDAEACGSVDGVIEKEAGVVFENEKEGVEETFVERGEANPNAGGGETTDEGFVSLLDCICVAE